MPKDWEAAAHPDDRTEFRAFRLDMIKRRVNLGLEEKDLQKSLNDSRARVETGSLAWKIKDAQAWCRALNGRLVVSFEGLTLSDPTDLNSFLTMFSSVYDEDTLHRYEVQQLLGMVRVEQGIEASAFAKLIGVKTGSAARAVEDGATNPILFALARHARALGGFIRLECVDA